MTDPWYFDDRDKAAMARASEKRRAAAWASVLALHGGEVIRWGTQTWGRVEALAERLTSWARGAGRRKPAPTSTWPWRRWAGSNVLVANLTAREAHEMRS